MTDSKQNHNNESLQHSENPAIELGNKFRHIREERDLSIGEVAERLKLPARQIESLESGNYEGLPEAVFIRGFLRTYGRFLEMDDNEIAQYLDSIFPQEHKSIYAIEFSKDKGENSLNYQHTELRRSFPKWIIAVIILIIIVIFIYAWQSKSNAENAKQSHTNTPASEVIAPSLMASNVSVIPMTSDVIASDVSTSASYNDETGTVNTHSTVAPNELVIKVRYRSMLTIKDKSGQFVINKVVPAGSEHHFKGGAPYDVWIGYATGATANYGGQEISVTNNILKGKKTASFKAG